MTSSTTTLADILRLPSALRAVDPRSAARAACTQRAARDAVCADDHYWCSRLGEDFGATEEGVPLAPSPLAGSPPDPPEPPAWRQQQDDQQQQKDDAPAPAPPPASSSSSPPASFQWHHAYSRWARAFPPGLPGPHLARAVRAWRSLERWLAQQGATHVLASLRPGASGRALALAAELLGIERLPLGLAALYSVHDGQSCPVGWLAASGAYSRDVPGDRHPPPLRRRLDALRRFEQLSREELGLAEGAPASPSPSIPLHSVHLAAFPSKASLPENQVEDEVLRTFVAHRCAEARAAEARRRQQWREQQQATTATTTTTTKPLPLSWEAAVLPHLARGRGGAQSAAAQVEARAGVLGGYRAYDRVPVQQLRPLHQVVPNALALMAEGRGGGGQGHQGQHQQPMFVAIASAAYADRDTLVCVCGGGGTAAGGGRQSRGGPQQQQDQQSMINPGDVFVVPANWRRLPPAHAQAALLRAHPPRSPGSGGANADAADDEEQEQEDGVLRWFEEFVSRCERGEYAFATTPTGGFYDDDEKEEEEEEEQEEDAPPPPPPLPLPPLPPPLPTPYWPRAFDEDRGNMEDAPGTREDQQLAVFGPGAPPRRSLTELGRLYGLRSDAAAPCGALSTLALPPSALVAEATTRGVRVRVSAALMPEECSSDQTIFCYCLRLSMPEDDPESYVGLPVRTGARDGGGKASSSVLARRRVQLISRSWRMLDAHGRLIDTASGQGVIGKHPLLWPGMGAGEFSYVSQTATPGGPVAAVACVAAAAAAASGGGGGGAGESAATATNINALAVPHPDGACCGYMEGTLLFVEHAPFAVAEDERAALPAAVAGATLQPPLPAEGVFEVVVPRFALVVPRFIF